MSAKILVADNSASDRSIIKNILNEYSVLTVCDGLEAMRQIDMNPDIDIIILDLNMPHMNGFDVLVQLKSDARYKKLRTIILTNADELENEIKGLKLGATDYLRKPIQKESLKVRIDMHVELLKQESLELKLHEQKVTFDALFQQAPIGIAISQSSEPIDADNNNPISINPMYEQITGITKEEHIKLGWAKITHPDDLEEDLKNYMKLQSGESKGYSIEKRYIKPDGSIVWVHMTVAPLHLSNGHKCNHICLIQDISKRKAIEESLLESERSKSLLLSHLPGLAYRCNYDREWTMQFVSAGCFKLTGYPPESLLHNKDLSFNDLIAPEYHKYLWEEWVRTLAKRLPFNYEYEIITAKGERKWVLELGEGVFNEQGEIEALEGIIFDITDRKTMENKLKYNNEHDRWTGLFNRGYLENLLKNDAKVVTTKRRAVVNINLSVVQSLITTYGFHYIQDLMKKTTDTLIRYCTNKCLLFNTYENRFVFYLKDYKDKNELIKFCEAIANTLESLLMAERIGGGIGVVEIDQDNESDVDQLLKRLLITSERAIKIYDREFSVCFFNSDMEAQINREEDIKRELTPIAADANNGRLFLQYQPILDLKSNQICGFEALARLNSEKLGLVPPLEFIPLAEKTKLIIPIGEKIMHQAFRFLNKLKEIGYGIINVSINVSAIQLLRNDFSKNLFEMINEMQVCPKNISLEITESIFASNYQEINRILSVLKDSGIHIAIDDFGTGYSSLARERELNVNCLKIDKYFIDKLLFLKPEDTLTGDIISMAHKLGHCAIAEGVEHEQQRQYLLSYDCDKIQGYLISKPLDEEAAIELLKKQKKANSDCHTNDSCCLKKDGMA